MPSTARASQKGSNATLDGLKRELTRLKMWRNRKLAHNQSVLHDPQFAAHEVRKRADDLYAIYEGTGQMVNKFSRLYRDVYAVLSIVDQNDYETVIGYISDVKCQQVHDYEKEFGKPADFHRPSNYEKWLERQKRM